MSERRGWIVYTTHETSSWLEDDDRVIVVDSAAPAAHVLEGMDAVIWRLLDLSYDHRRLVDLLQRFSDITQSEAERELHATLDRLTELGVLVRTAEVDHG
jgi:hypothetical protein